MDSARRRSGHAKLWGEAAHLEFADRSAEGAFSWEFSRTGARASQIQRIVYILSWVASWRISSSSDWRTLLLWVNAVMVLVELLALLVLLLEKRYHL